MFPTRDFVIMELVNTITDKPDWQRKVFDEAIVVKWRAEILDPNPPNLAPSEPEAKTTGTNTNGSNDVRSDASTGQRPAHIIAPAVSPRMFDWVIAEVKYKAKCFKQFNFIEALDGVWQSDTLVGQGLRQALEKAVKPLEEVPE
ncbi:MAG: hypothetical protein Q9183_005763, partial [Haloplaca sp. 2 TL-2023]